MALSKEEIYDIINKAIEAQFAPVKVKLDNLQKTIDYVKKDMDEDREGFAKMVTSQDTVERLTRELLGMYGNLVSRLERKVSDKAEETIQQAANVSAETTAAMVEPAIVKAVGKIKITHDKQRGWFNFPWLNKLRILL